MEKNTACVKIYVCNVTRSVLELPFLCPTIFKDFIFICGFHILFKGFKKTRNAFFKQMRIMSSDL